MNLNSRLYNLIKQVLVNGTGRREEYEYLVCLNWCGEVQHLSISNSGHYKKEFEESRDLQRCLVNTNNDAMNIVQFTQSLMSRILYTVKSKATQKDIDRVLANVSHFRRIIIYWSGHGSKLGIFTNGSPGSDILFDYKSLSRISNPHKFVILDSCHSGAFLKYGFWKSTASLLMICSCQENEESGAWIMDGTDSGGILTKCLSDPVSTWFKIMYKVFYTNETLFPIYNKFSKLMLEEIGMYDKLALIGIATYYQNLLILIKFGHLLFHPQHPMSFPDVSSTIHSKYWNEWEKQVETTLINTHLIL
jgi:hypothetical protein